MKRIVSVIAAIFLVSNWALAENVTLTFREGDGGAYSNTNDAQGNEEYPNYNLESSAYLSAGGPTGYQRVSFIQFPDIIGSNQGQIPPTSTIVSATLTITSTDATNTSISAYRVTEAMVYQPAGGGNGHNLSPSYGYRDGVTTAWSVFGCDGTPSREATPQDTKLVSQGYSGISFNVTSAVQNWANNPAQNWGLAFRGQNVIQGFYSSDEGNFTSFRPRLQVTFTPPAPATETLSFQKGDGGSYSDVEDSYLLSDFPTYTLSASAYLQAGANTSTRTCSVIRFPNIVGTNYGQIPDDAQIVSAKLVITSTDAQNIPVSVYKVTEPWHETGTVFGAGGQANDESPSWNERMKRVPWTTLGCGVGSRQAAALSTVTVSTGYSAIEWDVTAAVQAWADNRDQNFGLCVDAPDATVIQGFYSSNEGGFPQFRPKLEVEYVVAADTTPPDLVISTGTASDVSPAFVEGTCGADAVDVKIAVNGGASTNVIRRTATTWYTYVTLSSTTATHIAVTATDVADNVATVSQDLTWNVTDIPNASDLTILKGDTLILTATGTGTVLEIDPGTGTWQNAGAPGDKTVVTFDTAGSFVIRSRVDGGSVSSINVAVVSIDYGGAVACQVGYTRDLEIFVTPTSASIHVAPASVTPDLLRLQVDSYTANGVLTKLASLDRGTPVFDVRLGGSSGPVIALQEVDEFTYDVPAKDSIGFCGETNIGKTRVVIRPYIGNLNFDFNMYASQCTFAGGTTHFEANTTEAFEKMIDLDTGEIVGKMTYTVEMPEGENYYCFGIDVYQDKPGGTVEQVGEDPFNGKNCHCKIFPRCMCPNSSAFVKMTTWGNVPGEWDVKLDERGLYFSVTQVDRSIECGDEKEFLILSKDKPGLYDVWLEQDGKKRVCGQICVADERETDTIELLEDDDAIFEGEGEPPSWPLPHQLVNIPGGDGGFLIREFYDNPDCKNRVQLWGHMGRFKAMAQRRDRQPVKVAECAYYAGQNRWTILVTKCAEKRFFYATECYNMTQKGAPTSRTRCYKYFFCTNTLFSQLFDAPGLTYWPQPGNSQYPPLGTYDGPPLGTDESLPKW